MNDDVVSGTSLLDLGDLLEHGNHLRLREPVIVGLLKKPERHVQRDYREALGTRRPNTRKARDVPPHDSDLARLFRHLNATRSARQRKAPLHLRKGDVEGYPSAGILRRIEGSVTVRYERKKGENSGQTYTPRSHYKHITKRTEQETAKVRTPFAQRLSKIFRNDAGEVILINADLGNLDQRRIGLFPLVRVFDSLVLLLSETRKHGRRVSDLGLTVFLAGEDVSKVRSDHVLGELLLVGIGPVTLDGKEGTLLVVEVVADGTHPVQRLLIGGQSLELENRGTLQNALKELQLARSR